MARQSKQPIYRTVLREIAADQDAPAAARVAACKVLAELDGALDRADSNNKGIYRLILSLQPPLQPHDKKTNDNG